MTEHVRKHLYKRIMYLYGINESRNNSMCKEHCSECGSLWLDLQNQYHCHYLDTHQKIDDLLKRVLPTNEMFSCFEDKITWVRNQLGYK